MIRQQVRARDQGEAGGLHLGDDLRRAQLVGRLGTLREAPRLPVDDGDPPARPQRARQLRQVGLAVIEVMVKPGDVVKLEQSLITVESDKASMEIPSSHAGVARSR